jgi:membrane protein
MGYTFGLLLVVSAVLLMRVFGAKWVQGMPLLRFVMVLTVQTALFAGLFAVLPAGGNGFWSSTPGALLASVGWLVFSKIYSWYVTHLGGYTSVFGSVYAVALSMLWLYGCLCILFFGGVWNYQLTQKRK